MVWREAIESGTGVLSAAGMDESRLHAELLAAFVLGVWNRGEVRDKFSAELSPAEETLYHSLLNRRLAHEPLQHIVGETEFFGIRLKTTPAALIPRPESEILVEQALIELAKCELTSPGVLDLGTGSGAIALAIAHAFPSADVIGVDISEAALALAEENRDRLGLKSVRFARADMLKGILPRSVGGYALIVSNPPYIPLSEMSTLEPEVRAFEPEIALTDHGDGYEFYRRIASVASDLLAPHGVLMVELGHSGSDAVVRIFVNAGLRVARIEKDLLGIERVLVAGVA